MFGQVRLESFSSEEVGSWSALQSPRVVELFGVVREGPSIILFMDLKSSKNSNAQLHANILQGSFQIFEGHPKAP